MADNLLFFTELLGMPVLDLKGRRIGRVKDAALVPLVHASRIDRFLVTGGLTWLTIRFDQVRSISLDKGLWLSEEVLTPYHDDEYMLRIGRDLLDQQIIDVTGRKVVRVNDITMEIQAGAHDSLAVMDVDVGLRSVLRRLLQGVLPPRWIRSLQEAIPPNSIRWEFANVIEPDPLRRLRLNISYEKLEGMHPADLADIVEDLSPAERGAIFETIDSEVAADTLSEVEDPKMQASILEGLEPEKAADIVEEMAPDEAADILSELEEGASEDILDEMDSEPKTEVRELLEFEEDSAGGLMNTEFVALHENASVDDAMAALKGNEDLLDGLNTLFLIDSEERLIAAVPLARLFVAAGDAKLRGLAAETLIQAGVDQPQDRITELFDKYNLLTLPVVDEDGKLAGVITADDIISILRQK
jgi:sporulation protein YlmC with PRC-barrel domain/predicted transcriptional regulator